MADFTNVPTSVFELKDILDQGRVPLVTQLLQWGLLSLEKQCDRCKYSFRIYLDFMTEGDPIETCTGRCATPGCKNTEYNISIGTLIDTRFSDLSPEAKCLAAYAWGE
eukprot:3999615-Karenia_brevis.AAC.1